MTDSAAVQSLHDSFVGLDLSKLSAKDLIWAKVTKAPGSNVAGLTIKERDGGLFVTRVEGPFQMFTEVKVGDRLLRIQEKDVADMSLDDVNKILDQEKTIEVEVIHPKAEEDHEASATSVMTEDLEIQSGDILKLQGLHATPELNDQTCKVLRQSTKPGRFLIQTASNEKMIVDALNFSFPDDEEEVQQYIDSWKEATA